MQSAVLLPGIIISAGFFVLLGMLVLMLVTPHDKEQELPENSEHTRDELRDKEADSAKESGFPDLMGDASSLPRHSGMITGAGDRRESREAQDNEVASDLSSGISADSGSGDGIGDCFDFFDGF